jgi:hypothetical protein
MTPVFRHDLAPRTGWAAEIRKGQLIKVTDVEGGTISDIVTFNLHNLRDRFDQGRTKANQGRFKVSAGDLLYSKYNTLFMTILEDTTGGRHDLAYGMCNAWVFNSGKYKGSHSLAIGADLGLPTRGCWEILTEALAKWGIAAEDIPSPFNAFQDMHYNFETGEFGMRKSRNQAGDYVVLRAECDLLFAMTSCPCASRPNRVEIFDDTGAAFDRTWVAVPRRDELVTA